MANDDILQKKADESLNREDKAPPEVMRQGESVDQFRELMEHLDQVFWIKNALKPGVLYVSPAYEKVWGRTRQSLYDDFQSLQDSIHPDDRAHTDGPMDGNLDVRGREEEFRILRPDGEVRWIRSRSYPVRNKQGEIERHAGIDEDITEQKAFEKERSRLVAIVEYSDDVIVSTSTDGIIINWNHGAERQYGYSAEEIIGRSFSILFPPDHYREYLDVMKKIRRGEPMPSYETVRLRKDGTLVNMSVCISPIEDRSGEIIGASKISHDITKIKKLEAQFIEAQKMEVVGQLAAGVAHDFNNVLGIIMGYSELIAVELSPEHPLQKYAEEIRLATIRATGLTQQLLIFSRKQIVQAVVLDLNEVIKGVDKMLRRLIDENIEMSMVYGENIGHVKADSGHIWQVLMNMIVNARDAMPSGGELRIETKKVALDKAYQQAHPGTSSGDFVLLSISDTGSGMTEEVKARLFEAFFTTKPAGKGTGLGLVTCQTIVQQAGGHIDVSSELGQGTTFNIYFPSAELSPRSATRPLPTIGPLRRGTETILVVEDDLSVRLLAVKGLQAQGYTVLAAINGQDALRVVGEHKAEPIALVITDVIMPQMGGKVMAEWLKTTYPNLRILFTSGYTDDAIVREGILNPGVAFIAKPYTPTNLARKVREMLDDPRN
jgi:two-component system, cell cycle sensor histidine kinase and response regulator CckA